MEPEDVKKIVKEKYGQIVLGSKIEFAGMIAAQHPAAAPGLTIQFSAKAMKTLKDITVPDEIFLQYIDETELSQLKRSGGGVASITVYAEKPN